MKIVIMTIMYRRHKIFRDIYAKGVMRLIERFPEIDFHVLVVGTGNEDRQVAEHYGFDFHDYPNTNLGLKAQQRLEIMKNIKFDYCIAVGSDDFIDPEIIEYYIPFMEQGVDMIAPTDIYYWYEGDIYYSAGYPPGHPRHGEPLAVGRALSRKILEEFDFKLWGPMKRFIDGLANKKLKTIKNRHIYQCKDIGMICDVKSEEGLTKFHTVNVVNKTNKKLNL